MHLRRGEWRDAKHWAEQIQALEREPCQYAPVPHEVLDTTTGAADPGGARGGVDDLDGFGTTPQPNADLAHQLEDQVTIGR